VTEQRVIIFRYGPDPDLVRIATGSGHRHANDPRLEAVWIVAGTLVLIVFLIAAVPSGAAVTSVVAAP
jgi:hypothetical protein